MTSNPISLIFKNDVNIYRNLQPKYQRWSNIWRNKYSHKDYIGACNKAYNECNPKTYKDFFEYYINNVKSKEELINVAKMFYEEINKPNETTLDECLDIVIQHAIIETFDGKEKERMFMSFMVSNGFEALPVSDRDDRELGVDAKLKKNGKLLLVQIKPISFFLSNRYDCIRDRKDAFRKMNKALNEYKDASYYFSIYNKEERKWYSNKNGKIAHRIEDLIDKRTGIIRNEYFDSLILKDI